MTEIYDDDLAELVTATGSGLDLPEGWRGVLAPLGARSGDGRIIAAPDGELRLRQPPLPLLWQRQLSQGHETAEVAGRIDRVWVAGNRLMGEGPFDLDSDAGREAARQLAAGMANGVSVDLDDAVFELRYETVDGTPVEDPDVEQLAAGEVRELAVATHWRLMGATLVAHPAFDEARVAPVEDYDPAGEEDTDHVTAAVVGSSSLPVADRDRAWDGPAAKRRVFDHCTGEDGDVDVDCLSRAFLLRRNDVDAQTQAAWGLGYADVIDGRLTIVPRGVAALAGGRGIGAVEGISGDERERLRAKVCSLYAKVRRTHSDWPPCPFDQRSEHMLAAAGPARPLVEEAASNAPLEPPSAWFADPHLACPTPLTVTRDGRVMGHAAEWGKCHAGFPDVCFVAPRSSAGYAYFRNGTVHTSDGQALRVGKLTVGGGHADGRLGMRAAIEHYDNVAATVAVVNVGEDQHGVWVAGALRPGVTPQQVYDLLSSPLSGDWRTPHDGTGLELIAAHAVNVPGYGITAPTAATEDGLQVSLVAAGCLRPGIDASLAAAGITDPLADLEDRVARRVLVEIDARQARARRVWVLARRIGRDPDSRAAALAARIGRDGGQ